MGQALAVMDHLNIARVLDAGATDSGRPYFVMELVKGIPITEYCDQQRLSTRQRLELFIPVCQAVQHAHQKGIIHRDIKPTNILVTLHDGTPVPKIIDFGVAKAINRGVTQESLVTGFSQVIGTPLYMSPEQAEMSGLDIDTRTDVYALGVLLYELLAGTTPFEEERFSEASYDEMRRIIREEEPPRPSTRMSTLGDLLDTVAEKRQTDSRALTRQVSGELDWIVMKALEKDRARRYETATDFAKDVQRYLDDETVEACPPSAVYRFRRFVRRHRGKLAAIATLAGLLLMGTVVSMCLAAWAFHAEDIANTQRALAENGERIARRSLYAANMNLAQYAWRSGHASRTLELLESHRPQSDQEDLRGFEWYYLWRLSHSDRSMLLGHRGSVNGVAISPDGKTLASAGFDNTVRLWDLATGRTRAVLEGHPQAVACAAFAPNGRTLALGGMDHTTILWDIDSGTPRACLRGHTQPISAVAFSPDGTVLVTASHDETIRVWDAATGHVQATLTGHTAPVWSVAFSPDGEHLASGACDNTVKIWHVATAKEDEDT